MPKPTKSPPALTFPTPSGDGEVSFHDALDAYLKALGWTEHAAAEAFTAEGNLGLVRNHTVWRWRKGPERSKVGQTPLPDKQRAVLSVLTKAWRREEQNRRRREQRAARSST